MTGTLADFVQLMCVMYVIIGGVLTLLFFVPPRVPWFLPVGTILLGGGGVALVSYG